MINRNICWRSSLLGILLIALLLSSNPLVAYAEGGDGTGSATGVMKPLALVSVTLEDGTNVINAENMPLKPKLTMHFDKNVVYLIYWEKNTHCFHLYDDNGKELALNLTKIDDTVDFSKRQYIWAEPVEALSPGTNYKLYVSQDLLAKNGGSTLGMTTNNQGVNINFKTAGTKTVAPSVATSAPVEVPTAPVAASAQDTVAAVTPTVADPTSETKSVDVTFASTNTDVTKKDTVTSDSPATTQPNVEADANLNNGGAQTKLADQTKIDAAAQFAANEKARRVQNYAAAVAVIILLVWIGAEVMRRKRKRGLAGKK